MVSTFENVFAKADKTPREILEVLTDERYKKAVEEVRRCEYHSKEQKELKQKLPVYTMGVFTGKRKAENILDRILLIALDFDRKDNDPEASCPNYAFRAFKHTIAQDPYIWYCGLSCSGMGWRVIMPITSTDKRDRQYDAAVSYFYKRYGMIADKSCKDEAHAFFVSYDNEPYINVDAKPFPFAVDGNSNSARTSTEVEHNGDIKEAIKLFAEIEKAEADNLAAFDNYEEWVRMGFALVSTFGEDGRYFFHKLSALSEKYDVTEADTKYDSLLKSYSDKPQKATLASIYWDLANKRKENEINNDFKSFSE